MKKEAILHIPLSQFAYAKNESTLVIRIRTAKNDVDSVALHYGDRVDMVQPIRTKRLEMDKVSTDDLFDYYQVEFTDKYTRVCYYFEISGKTEKCFYYERGFTEEISDNRTEFFQFPYIRREDILNIPDWAKSIVMYHIFPDSFASGKGVISGVSGESEGSISNLGGTLRGVMENLDYIAEMGINAIYLNPIFRSGTYHKYDTMDYYEIDSCLGTKEDLRTLVKQCHNRNIRVILDGVFNHSGPNFFAFKDVLEKGKNSPYYSWYYKLPDMVEYKDPPNYEAFAYVKEMPKLNTGNPEVVDYFCEVGAYWIKEADIDGWRLDVANEINHDFWRAFRKRVRAEKADCLLIAEIWEDSNIWLQGDQFDSSMNYMFSNLCRDFFAERKMTVSQFDQQINKMLMRYPYEVALAQMNILDSHDIPRFLTYCHGDKRRMELAFFYMFMSVGIPSVFYGDECYLEGMSEPEYRQCMQWNPKDSCYDSFKKWIKLRREHTALTAGAYKTILCDDEKGVYGFCRKTDGEEMRIYINNSDNATFIDGNTEIKPMSWLIA